MEKLLHTRVQALLMENEEKYFFFSLALVYVSQSPKRIRLLSHSSHGVGHPEGVEIHMHPLPVPTDSPCQSRRYETGK